jgi:hypothetical protein
MRAPGALQSTVQHTPGRALGPLALKILTIARLLADQHYPPCGPDTRNGPAVTRELSYRRAVRGAGAGRKVTAGGTTR